MESRNIKFFFLFEVANVAVLLLLGSFNYKAMAFENHINFSKLTEMNWEPDLPSINFKI